MQRQSSSKTVRALAVTALSALGLAAPVLAATDLVANGGFETGDLSSWSGSILDNPYSGVICAGSAAQGLCDAFLGTNGSTDTLSQVLATVDGQAYQVSFSFTSDGSSPASFSVNFGNQALYSVNSAAEATKTYSFQTTAASAATELVFSFNNDPGYYRLDAVSVTAVPEPAAGGLMALGLLGLAGLSARRRRPSDHR